jgi:hypothetical protein
MKRLNNMKYSVFVTFQIEGFHCWPEAKDVFPEVAFLSDRHRHMFHFKCYAQVTHTDRDEEFILMQRRIKKQLRNEFGWQHIRIWTNELRRYWRVVVRT